MRIFRFTAFAALALSIPCTFAQYQLKPFPKFLKPPIQQVQPGPQLPSQVSMPSHAPGIQGPFAAILRGGGYPWALRVSEIPADFMAAKISSEGSSPFDSMMTPMMMLGMSGQGGPDTGMMTILGALDLSWSRGDVTIVDGRSYLVTYKVGLDLSEMSMLTNVESFANTMLRLTLVRTDSIKSIIPRPDMTRAQFQTLMVMRIQRPKPIAVPGDTGH